MILRYNKNLYDEVINGNETYKAIATNIKKGFSTLLINGVLNELNKEEE